jgi:hypothetical protein
MTLAYKRKEILVGNAAVHSGSAEADVGGHERRILDAGASDRTSGHAGVGAGQRYYAFPTLLRLASGEVLVIYKNGEKHLLDSQAPLGAVVIDPLTGKTSPPRTIADTPGWIYQNPELMRMPDRSIMLFTDIQKPGKAKARIGLRVHRSRDEGASFQDEGWFPPAGGYRFGYAFDDALSPGDSGTVNLLVMSFPELEGGIRAVHAVRTRDNGGTWEYIRNLNEEFGFAFNESALLPWGDGFVMITRGDDQVTHAVRTDADFRLLGKENLSARHDEIEYIGRPELFMQDGRCYLLCRNIAKGKKTGTLELFRLDPDTLTLQGNVRLDENESPAGDSYYAEHYMAERNGRLYFNAITYVPKSAADKPDIVRLEYDWEELRSIIG